MKFIVRISLGFMLLTLLALGGYAALNWVPDRTVAELSERWAKPPSRFVEINGLQVHLRDEGPRDDQVPIVLIHGTSSSLHTWNGWADGLRQSRRVVRFDLPGFGLTGPSPDANYDIRDYVEFVIRVLDELKIDTAQIVGNSLGGNIAWMTAVEYPSRVERLILIDASGYAVTSRSVPIGFRIASIPFLKRAMEYVLPRKLVRASVENVYGDPDKVTSELVDRYFELTTREGNREAMIRRFEQITPGKHAELIPKITQPTLILWGARDELIPLSAAERFAADIPDSELVVFENLGHVPQEESPAKTLQASLSFLEAGRMSQ